MTTKIQKPDILKARFPLNTNSNQGLTVTGYGGKGNAMLAFDIEDTTDFAGFAIECFPPQGQPYWLMNRLSRDSEYTSETEAEQIEWTESNKAPFQKFRWVHVPEDNNSGDAVSADAKTTTKKYSYQVTAMYFAADKSLKAGPQVAVSIDLSLDNFENFQLGFTRGYLSSQAYADKFKNAPIRPLPKTLNYNPAKYEKQYEWLGYEARALVHAFLHECLHDPEVTVDVYAYDFDDVEIIAMLQQLGSRLRIFFDNAPLHTKDGALEPEAWEMIRKTAGSNNVRTGHFERFSHNKVMIKKRNGNAEAVIAGSMNYSVRGMYVQANNVFRFDSPQMALLYEEAFEQGFSDQHAFKHSHIAEGWFEEKLPGVPRLAVSFAPHTEEGTSLDRLSQHIQDAKTSVLFAVMNLTGGGPVMDDIKDVAQSNRFYYGVVQSLGKMSLYKPGNPDGIIVPFAYLNKMVPQPFKKELSGLDGAAGQIIHHKFVVCDFNGDTPLVAFGSSNLSAGGETHNSDNLLIVYDRDVATAFAIEAVRLVDHYHFRSAMKEATKAEPLKLSSDNSWTRQYFDKNNRLYTERMVFAYGKLK